jgi:putative spermidine/putrescine transport system ATP-binding protein
MRRNTCRSKGEIGVTKETRVGDYVVFDHVQKSYDGETLVVKDLNLSIGRGEFLTMLGPSGSGKTTCLMMLAGFETATHGEIRLDGHNINLMPPHKRGIGMVFQNYALFPHMTVGENLSFPLEVRGMGKDERESKVKRALDMVQMGAFANRRPAQLSGGQQQRIALARALVFDPKLVLMDEPLGALDKQLREHMQFEIKHLHESLGITVVYVTHDQGEALTMSDRVAVFNDGRIQQLAPPADLYERPENSFVAQFIGENNKLPGTVEELSGDKALVRLSTGELIDATPVNVTQKGQKTLVSIRPERVEFKPEMMPDGAHMIGAEVVEVIYMGDILRVVLRVAGSEGFVMKMRNTLGQTRLEPGQKIQVGWHPADARALDPA